MESRRMHCTRDVIDPRRLLSNGAEVTPRTLCAGSRVVPLLATFPATPASVWSPTVRRHVSKTKAAVTPICLSFPADPAGDPPNLNVGRLK